jgi:hypothetical protein
MLTRDAIPNRVKQTEGRSAKRDCRHKLNRKILFFRNSH